MFDIKKVVFCPKINDYVQITKFDPKNMTYEVRPMKPLKLSKGQSLKNDMLMSDDEGDGWN